MRIINATWEKRNLGVECTELDFSYEDTVSEANEAIKQLNTEYQLIRIPSGKTDLLLLAQKYEFKVIEMNIQLTKKLDHLELPKIYKRFENLISVEAVTDSNLVGQVLNEIKKGDIFVTDKIALDPFFSPQLSGQRYYYWSQDVLNNGGQLYMAKYNNMNIGFCLNVKKSDTLYEAFLGGIFSAYKNKGLGFIPFYATMLATLQRGGNSIVLGVSSNNLPILRIYNIFGFTTLGMSYILIKHK